MQFKIKNTIFSIDSIDSKENNIGKLMKQKNIELMKTLDKKPRFIQLKSIDDYLKVRIE